MINNEYWIARNIKAQQAITDKSISDIEKQLKKYFFSAMEQTINDFESTYDKILASGEKMTPADLYKLDKYWKAQANLQHNLQNLGDKAIPLLQKQFLKEYTDIYKALSIKGGKSFSSIDSNIVNQLINQIWTADGIQWSQRIWQNTSYLQQTLNEQLVNCVVTGKKTTHLKGMLQERFGVSYNRADTLVRTEIAHIETTSAAQKYQDSGLKRYEILVSPDKRTCDICSAFEGKQFYFTDMQCGINAPPFHPNCRDCIVPIIE